MRMLDREIQSLIANSMDVSTHAHATANALEPMQKRMEQGDTLSSDDAAGLIAIVREGYVRVAQAHSLLVAMLTAAHERASGVGVQGDE